MKQLLQNLKTGNIELQSIPLPNCSPNDILIQTHRSLISPGTERMLLNFGQSSYLQKAKQQPEKVKQVIDKIKTDGLLPTFQAVNAKLSNPLPLGYSNAGIVLAVGSNVTEFKVGAAVISNGNHASVTCVTKNLVAKIPNNVTNEQAVFTVIASIALQGVRICTPTLGETIVVIGLGLIGQITLDLLKVNGCRAIGFDIDSSRVQLAKSRGFDAFNSLEIDSTHILSEITNQIGADAVIIAASTKGNEPTEQAVSLCRKKGRIVAVGAFKMDIPREDFYKKELSFHISMSYGPGRYDKNYEEKSVDYPIGYVRWTENRNFEAILQLLSNQQLDFSYLISKEVEFNTLDKHYADILNSPNCLGALIKYPIIQTPPPQKTITINRNPQKIGARSPNIGVIGAGNFATTVLLPLLKKQQIPLIGISSFKGLSATLAAKKFNFSYATTDYNQLLADKTINTIIISTQHSSHTKLVCEALNAGKHVFVEKPLAVNQEQLDTVIHCYKNLKSNPILMVGFNRRFSPLTTTIYNYLKNRVEPLSIHIQVNARFIPKDHWVHDPKNGGRFIGEGCHFIDLIHYLTNSRISHIQSIGKKSHQSAIQNDTTMTQLMCEDGSIGSIHYLSNGNKTYPKEKITIFSEGRVLEIDNWKKIRGYGTKNHSYMQQKKGHEEELSAFLKAIENKSDSPISFNSLVHVTQLSFAHVQALETHKTTIIPD